MQGGNRRWRGDVTLLSTGARREGHDDSFRPSLCGVIVIVSVGALVRRTVWSVMPSQPASFVALFSAHQARHYRPQ
jgi:hypothetical protein